MITDLSTTALLVCNSIDHDFPLSSDEKRKKRNFARAKLLTAGRRSEMMAAARLLKDWKAIQLKHKIYSISTQLEARDARKRPPSRERRKIERDAAATTQCQCRAERNVRCRALTLRWAWWVSWCMETGKKLRDVSIDNDYCSLRWALELGWEQFAWL